MAMAQHFERFHSVSKGMNDSLLDPAHFNAILYGNCSKRDDVNTYRQCSSLSQTTGYEGEENPRKFVLS